MYPWACILAGTNLKLELKENNQGISKYYISTEITNDCFDYS